MIAKVVQLLKDAEEEDTIGKEQMGVKERAGEGK